jgi:hypothetical protein
MLKTIRNFLIETPALVPEQVNFNASEDNRSALLCQTYLSQKGVLRCGCEAHRNE